MSATTIPSTAQAPPTTAAHLSLTRLHLMRAGYLLMVVGLALKKWPLLPDAHTMPLYEGVTLCILVAMSLLAVLPWDYAWRTYARAPGGVVGAERHNSTVRRPAARPRQRSCGLR